MHLLSHNPNLHANLVKPCMTHIQRNFVYRIKKQRSTYLSLLSLFVCVSNLQKTRCLCNLVFYTMKKDKSFSNSWLPQAKSLNHSKEKELADGWCSNNLVLHRTRVFNERKSQCSPSFNFIKQA